MIYSECILICTIAKRMANSLNGCGSVELPSRNFFVADGLHHGTIIQ